MHWRNFRFCNWLLKDRTCPCRWNDGHRWGCFWPKPLPYNNLGSRGRAKSFNSFGGNELRRKNTPIQKTFRNVCCFLCGVTIYYIETKTKHERWDNDKSRARQENPRSDRPKVGTSQSTMVSMEGRTSQKKSKISLTVICWYARIHSRKHH